MCSNRCAALLKIAKVQKALADADKCIELRPEWEKGYFRKGSALEAISDYPSALDVYREGMKCAPESAEFGVRIQRLETVVRKQKRRAQAS
jgi:tetratricopeptide (TPR) repeat protein